jgi:N6-adenosine-specific RNA methylase IME4
MSFKDILALEIPAAEDCVLFLWVTDPYLEKAMGVINAWGFKYKTVAFTWVKTNKSDEPWTGMGFWTRANPEQCLLATRGHPSRVRNDVAQLIIAPRREHSRKPDEIYHRIERLVAGPYLELFARQRRDGWDATGDEIDKFAGPGA